MGLRNYVVSQFRKPSGPAGWLAGWIMAARASNRLRNRWLVEQAGIGPNSSVLEIGCGPGLALGDCLDRVRNGSVVGIDHSGVMIIQAAHRHWTALQSGRLELHRISLGGLALLNRRFDRIISANVLHFLNTAETEDALRALHRLLGEGGVLATVYQPRHGGATDEDARRYADRLAGAMERLGFSDVSISMQEQKPVSAVCIIGSKRKTGELSRRGAAAVSPQAEVL